MSIDDAIDAYDRFNYLHKALTVTILLAEQAGASDAVMRPLLAAADAINAEKPDLPLDAGHAEQVS